MNLAEIIRQTRDEEWDTGYYIPSWRFQAVTEHIAVMGARNQELIAVTGPTGDRESRIQVRLMAAAPEMGRLLLHVFEHGLDAVTRDCIGDLLYNQPIDDAEGLEEDR